jgi:hypothetical protein
MMISLSSHLLGCLVRELNYGPWPVTSDMAVSFVGGIRVGENIEIYRR